MTPTDVINRLNKMAVNWSRTTLLKAVKDKLGPTPKTGGSGRGYGRWTQYSDDAYTEFYASHILVKKLKMNVEDVAKARESVLAFLSEYARVQPCDSSEVEKKLQRIEKDDMFEHLESFAQNVIDTPGAIDWWKNKQSESLNVDLPYAYFQVYFNGYEIDNVKRLTENWKISFLEILEGLESISKLSPLEMMDFDLSMKTLKEHPQMGQIYVAMMQRYPDINDSTIYFLARGVVPQHGRHKRGD